MLVDRPQSPQSVILGGHCVLPVRGTDDALTLIAANEVLGGNFLSRINMDLRETKGWSYGVARQRQPAASTGPLHHHRAGPGRQDRAGRSQALMRQVRELPRPTRGLTDVELERMINGNIRQLAGQFETSRGGARRRFARTPSIGARTIIRRRSPTAIAAMTDQHARHAPRAR